MTDALDRYRDLRARVDAATGRLVDLHCKHLACRPGCSGCCVDLTVSPAEYHAILHDLRAAGVTPAMLPHPAPPAPDEPPEAREERAETAWAEGCTFLTAGGLCGLYAFRPLICRTHGLPIAFDNDDPELPGKAVSFCPLNFTADDAADVDFGPTTTLDLDALNAELADINAAFADERHTHTRRIPLRQLRQDL